MIEAYGNVASLRRGQFTRAEKKAFEYDFRSRFEMGEASESHTLSSLESEEARLFMNSENNTHKSLIDMIGIKKDRVRGRALEILARRAEIPLKSMEKEDWVFVRFLKAFLFFYFFIFVFFIFVFFFLWIAQFRNICLD